MNEIAKEGKEASAMQGRQESELGKGRSLDWEEYDRGPREFALVLSD